MLDVDIKGLIQKLNRFSTKALEGAAGQCISRGHYEITVEHVLLAFLEDPEADVQKILHQYGISPARPLAALQRSLDRLKSGNTGRPVFSPMLLEWLQDAWLLTSVEHVDTRIRSGHLFLVILLRPDRYTSDDITPLFDGVKRDELRRDFYRICGGSKEAEAPPAEPGAAAAAGAAPGRPVEETAIGRFMVDVTDKARRGEIDPVLGRDREIRQMIDILARRRKNNPIVVGEPGTGKTAVVEGLGLRIAEGDVPDALRNVRLLTLDLGLLQAGAGVKGEFENRLKSVIQEVKASPIPVITFIDEAHTLIGSGGSSGGSDAANLLKPALARGELRTIAATTWSEYKKYFEKDAALARRFQLVKIDEPSVEDTILIMRGLREKYEEAHQVRIAESAVEAAAVLSSRYISGRQLPDKAVDLLDTASARVKIGRGTVPEQVDDLQRRLIELDRERESLLREETLAGVASEERMAELDAERERIEGERAKLLEQWEREKALVATIEGIRNRLEGKPAAASGEKDTAAGETKEAEQADQADQAEKVGTEEAPKKSGESQADPAGDEAAPAPPRELTPDERQALRAELDTALAELAKAQGDIPMAPLDVDGRLVGSVVASWTGIPVGKMVQDEATQVLAFRDRLAERIKGQDHALDAVDRGMRAARAGVKNPNTPIGVFLFVGPSGVGKTETGLAVADLMFGGERFLTTINMSEFQEKHTVSRLIGSPPGYVGYGEGGVLTEAVRQRPYSVILLDEVEKADPEVMNLFYQVFDKGMLSDGEGRVIDFKNTVVILTSNLATDLIMEIASGPVRPSHEELLAAIRPTLSKHFKPALLGRMEVVPFFPLGPEVLKEIVKIKLRHVGRRLADSHKIELEVDTKVDEVIVARCTDVDSGARNIDHIVNQTLLPLLSTRLLQQMAEGPLPAGVQIGVDETEAFTIAFG